jgi:hypothetical protein
MGLAIAFGVLMMVGLLVLGNHALTWYDEGARLAFANAILTRRAEYLEGEVKRLEASPDAKDREIARLKYVVSRYDGLFGGHVVGGPWALVPLRDVAKIRNAAGGLGSLDDTPPTDPN